MESQREQKHWIIRVQDGENFRNSKYPFWGLKRGKGGGIKTIVNKLKPGDILWFLTSKSYGGNFIGMSEYTCYYDKDDEPLVPIHTYSNIDQCWTDPGLWSIQIHYKNLYITHKQNIQAIIQCAGTILEYDRFKDRGLPDLNNHYNNFKYYAEPNVF